MTDLLLVALAAATVNNPAALRMLGLGTLLGDGLPPANATGAALATVLGATIAAVACHLLDSLVLRPNELGFLRIIAFLVLTTGAVAIAARISARLLGQAPALPLLLINGVVVGMVLLEMRTMHTPWDALATGLGAGLGYSLILVLFAGLQPRLERAAVPAPLRGPAIGLITLGITSMALVGFSGLGN